MPDPPPLPPVLCVLDAEPGGTPTWAVVIKPTGLHAVPGRTPDKFDSIQARARIAFPHAEGPITVHRLDRDTSGLMILGLTRAAHSHLSVQFQDRKVTKTYTALLERTPPANESEINLPLIVDWPNRPRHHVNHDTGKPARTTYRVTTPGQPCRVELTPITGRTHQLRVHAAHPVQTGGMGAPILGDPLYGSPDSASRLMLHASRLSITLPGRRTPTTFESPPDF
ncbi:MAG: pseudouridine synthase [Planctomycetota bacterium]